MRRKRRDTSSPLGESGSVWNEELFQFFTTVDVCTVSWKAVARAIRTVISLVAFSLIHVPNNIPDFAILNNVEPDMNAELMVLGYSNALAGLFGGLQNYMAYSNSVNGLIPKPRARGVPPSALS